jgi:ABC-type dipeptide/oligopeptide/nickel transport system ATPase component
MSDADNSTQDVNTPDTSTPDNVLQIRDLAVEFKTDTGLTHALNNVGFDVPRGQVTAIVGESGSGKSVTANCIMRLIQPPGKITGGTIDFAPKSMSPFEIVGLGKKDPRLHELRGGLISMVFQEPMTALSPVYTVGNQVAEAILCHRKVTKEVAWQEAADMLQRVGIGDIERRMKMYPFEFSGGMRQRVVIAMALVCSPELLICDEPTTALDVTIQAEILTLIRDLQRELSNSVLFITHDLGVVAQLADQVVVMYQGRVLEIGSVRQVLKTPVHPYTKGLLAAIPGLAEHGKALATIASVIGDTDISTPYPLVTLKDGRQVSLPPDQLPGGDA